MKVIYEDNHIIIVSKTVNEIVQGDKTGDETLIDKVKKYIKEKYSKPGEVFLGLTHRLDRPTSGVVVFAKTSKALSRLNAMFRDGEVHKTYWAVTSNRPDEDEGTLENFLKKNEKLNKSFIAKPSDKEAKKAILNYKIIAVSDRYYLWEINLLTGRHHQIRCQLANIGCPIKGDLKYGYPRSNPDGGLSLHARKVEFIHPVSKKEISVTADVPEGDKLWEFFQESVTKD
ncbi:MAG: RNA pseudouridine synthase [Bacteroidales bacterium]|nr:RNA pseudouridine synthase [Bacteroidales bacterium]MBQ5540882.1 RNA pseudouridine synthase [Bacteroidales bacterium]MEE3447018.1 RNA pseudouridine synthase [Bacteroidales bacterium]